MSKHILIMEMFDIVIESLAGVKTDNYKCESSLVYGKLFQLEMELKDTAHQFERLQEMDGYIDVEIPEKEETTKILYPTRVARRPSRRRLRLWTLVVLTIGFIHFNDLSYEPKMRIVDHCTAKEKRQKALAACEDDLFPAKCWHVKNKMCLLTWR